MTNLQKAKIQKIAKKQEFYFHSFDIALIYNDHNPAKLQPNEIEKELSALCSAGKIIVVSQSAIGIPVYNWIQGA